MAPKRGAGGLIKADPDAKRVKREGGAGDNIDLSSIPMAPTYTASAFSSAVVPKFDVNDRKPLGTDVAPGHGGQPEKSQRKRRYFGGSVKARRGTDWVSAHFTKSDMTVAFTVNRQWPSTWQSEGVEREIIQRLNSAKFEVAPTEDWGFIDRHIYLTIKNGMSNTLTSSSSSGYPTHLHFTFRVKVRNTGQDGFGANMDVKDAIRPGQHASAYVEPKIEAPLVKSEEQEKKFIPRR
ncbi:hypothetical protein VMCG_08663 [Cytospora schulzeri]|uniref:Uncharacterized protein n=1 Tax=Cytospora schulzeri TaxID=448051 RepID=A0A423VT96_9PEZI|nr:hypothetical protein VMCG_08663 [Valsa malicola]